MSAASRPTSRKKKASLPSKCLGDDLFSHPFDRKTEIEGSVQQTDRKHVVVHKIMTMPVVWISSMRPTAWNFAAMITTQPAKSCCTKGHDCFKSQALNDEAHPTMPFFNMAFTNIVGSKACKKKSPTCAIQLSLSPPKAVIDSTAIFICVKKSMEATTSLLTWASTIYMRG